MRDISKIREGVGVLQYGMYILVDETCIDRTGLTGNLWTDACYNTIRPLRVSFGQIRRNACFRNLHDYYTKNVRMYTI